MKLLLIALSLFAACIGSAQNFAVWTHQAANTDAFQKGCPGEWPYVAQSIGAKTIPADLVARGWKQMTKAELDSVIKTLAPAKETWNLEQEVAGATPKRDRDALIKQAKDDLTTIVNSSGTLTAAQLSNAVRTIARTLRALIEDLGH